MITVPAVRRDREDLGNHGAPHLPSAQTYPADLWARALRHFPTQEKKRVRYMITHWRLTSEADTNSEHDGGEVQYNTLCTCKVNLLTPECHSYSSVRRRQAWKWDLPPETSKVKLEKTCHSEKRPGELRVRMCCPHFWRCLLFRVSGRGKEGFSTVQTNAVWRWSY